MEVNKEFHAINILYPPHRWIIIGQLIVYAYLLTYVPFLFSLPKEWTALEAIGRVVLLLPIPYLLSRPGFLKRPPLAPLEFHTGHFVCPKTIGCKKYYTTNYQDLRAIDLRGKGRARFMVLETKQRHFSLPRHSFNNEQDFSAIAEYLEQGILHLADGASRMRLIETKAKIAKNVFGSFPYCTAIIAAFCFIVFLLQSSVLSFDPFALAGFGASNTELVYRGDYFRIISCTVLHSNTGHFVLNIICLAALGKIIEGLIGPFLFVVLFFISMVIGSTVSALSGAVLTVGISSGIFGLLGALATFNLLRRHEMPAGLAFSYRVWGTILLSNVLFVVFLPKLDWHAHLLGFITGGVLTGVLIASRGSLPFLPLSRVWAMLGCSTIIILIAVSLLQSARCYLDHSCRHAANLTVQQSYLASAHVNADGLNGFAWDHAVRKQVTSEELNLAEQAVRRSLKMERKSPTIDTLATVLYRLKRYEEASEVEEQAWEKAEDEEIDDEGRSFYASQLVRFLMARNRSRTDPMIVLALQENELVLPAVLTQELPAELCIVVTNGAKPVYLIRQRIDATNDTIELSPAVFAKLTLDQLRFEVLWLKKESASVLGDMTVKLSEEVFRYP